MVSVKEGCGGWLEAQRIGKRRGNIRGSEANNNINKWCEMCVREREWGRCKDDVREVVRGEVIDPTYMRPFLWLVRICPSHLRIKTSNCCRRWKWSSIDYGTQPLKTTQGPNPGYCAAPLAHSSIAGVGGCNGLFTTTPSTPTVLKLLSIFI